MGRPVVGEQQVVVSVLVEDVDLELQGCAGPALPVVAGVFGGEEGGGMSANLMFAVPTDAVGQFPAWIRSESSGTT